VLHCPLYAAWSLSIVCGKMHFISIGYGSPVLTVKALSTKLDGITLFISPVLSVV
jgi:hypothetical protein